MSNSILRSIYLRLAHLRALRSVNWWTLFRRIATLRADYKRPDGRNRCIVNITCELTYRCNQKCAFCFLRRIPAALKCDELTTAEIMEIVKSAARMRAGLYFTGGEPLLRKDISEIVSAAKQRAVKCGINTNGLLLDQLLSISFAKAGLDYLIVSISSGVASEHDAIVGVEGAFDETKANAKRFISISPATQVFMNFVISPESVQRLKSVVHVAADLGADAVTCQHMQYLTKQEVEDHERVWARLLPQYPIKLIYATPPAKGMPIEEMARLIKDARLEAERLGIRCLVKPPLGSDGLRQWYEGPFPLDTQCHFPWTDMRVAPNGDVYTCQFVPVVVGNIREKRIEQLLNAKPYCDFRVALRQTDGVFPACARCCKLYRSPFSKMAKSSPQG